jgi:hypothetical protein
LLTGEGRFVEIISWNDYGESHYIGPLYESSFAHDFDVGKPPYNYVRNMPHDGWRKFLPFVIDTYKSGRASITKEGLVSWYRTSPGSACGTGETVGNTASQLQVEFPPSQVMQDRVFFSALLGSSATITVSIGGATQTGKWSHTPEGGVGLYHGSVPFNGAGAVVITLSRGGTQVTQISNGPAISSSCTNGITNWNAWVGEADGGAVSATPPKTRSQQMCVNGTGINNFVGLCDFSCKYGYCPISACLCKDVAAPVPAPSATGKMGYPITGLDASYSGLCAFDCPHNYCPPAACGTVQVPLSTPTVSPFAPPACRAGKKLASASDALTGLCSMACTYGFCPSLACECTSQGALIDSNSIAVAAHGTPVAGLKDYGLCDWTCSHGYCPSGACIQQNGTTGGPGGDGGGSGDFFVDPGVWVDPQPTVGCYPPCTLHFPPIYMPTPFTVSWPPYPSAVYSSSSGITKTITTVISIPPFVISSMSFWPVTINSNDPVSGVITPIQSVVPPATVISFPSNVAPIGITQTSGAATSQASSVVWTFVSLPPTWGGGLVTIQPMPTVSVVIPAGDSSSTTTTTTGGAVVIVGTTSKPVAFTQSSTGGKSTPTPAWCSNCGPGGNGCRFGCGHGCGLFGCGGGCGIFGCGGGGCGLFGCGGSWNDNGCKQNPLTPNPNVNSQRRPPRSCTDYHVTGGPAGCGCKFGCTGGVCPNSHQL